MLTQSETTLLLRRNWLVGGYLAEFSSTHAITPQHHSNLIDRLLRAIRINLLESDTGIELINIKGRDRGEMPIPSIPKPTGEELFSIGGTIATSIQEPRGDFVWENFQVACHTSFNRFEGSRSIIYTPHLLRSDTIPSWYPWWLMGFGAPIRPTYLRLGFELFTSKFALARLSFMPVPTEKLLIDLSAEVLKISISTEQPRWKASNPFEKVPLFSAIDVACEAACGASLRNLFKDEIEKRI